MSIMNYGRVALARLRAQIWDTYSAKLIVGDTDGVDYVNEKKLTFKSNSNLSVNSPDNVFSSSTNKTISVPVGATTRTISFAEANGKPIKQMTLQVSNSQNGYDHTIYISPVSGTLSAGSIVGQTYMTLTWTAASADGEATPTLLMGCDEATNLRINNMDVVVGRF